jgi:TatA/E family protein of Tat protein translocase
MHLVNYVIIAIIVLALFGPKTLQSMARGAGKTASEIKQGKDKLMSDLSLDDVKRVSETLNKVPTSPQRVLNLLLSSDEQKKSTEQD